MAAAAGDEIYVHEWSIDGTCTSLTALTMSPQQIATGIIPTTGTEDFDLTVTVPTITTATDAQNVNVTVTASATP